MHSPVMDITYRIRSQIFDRNRPSPLVEEVVLFSERPTFSLMVFVGEPSFDSGWCIGS